LKPANGQQSTNATSLHPDAWPRTACPASRKWQPNPSTAGATIKLLDDLAKSWGDSVTWQVAEAKNKLSDVITRALTDGPQRIRRRGQVVVVLSEADYQRLTGERETLTSYLLRAPDLSELDLTRDDTLMRDVAR
jgi:antitoxin Phd